MISCTEFIPAYSELFKFLEKKGGKEAVVKYWRHISRSGLERLRKEVTENGIRGCYRYWSHTLNEEAADFTMTLDEENGKFEIDMHVCPSKGKLLDLKHMEPYPDYCKHCDILYREVLEPMGFKYKIDLSQTGRARCRLTVQRPPA
jgi:hypothetical protein